MGRRFTAFLLVFLLLLGGCGRYAPTDDADDTHKKSDAKDQAEDSKLARIVLEENPTTGYLWQYTLEPEGIVEVVEDEYRHQGGPDTDGAGGEHVWILKGIKEGTATMTFICSLVGNKDEISGYPVVYEITVDSDGKIVLSEE